MIDMMENDIEKNNVWQRKKNMSDKVNDRNSKDAEIKDA